MAIFRKIHVSFWQDPFVLKLTPEEKYFYLYLMTNPKTTQSGIYELPKTMMIVETGYNHETVEKLLQKFISYGKIIYDDQFSEVMIVNWIRYNYSQSPQVRACIKKEIKLIKSKILLEKLIKVSIEYGYNINTEMNLISEEKEQEEETEEEKVNNEHPLNIWIKENCKRVASLKKQMTIDECDKLIKKNENSDIKDMLRQMENYNPLTKKYVSVYMTLNNWLSKEPFQGGRQKHREDNYKTL